MGSISPQNQCLLQGQEHQPELGWVQFQWRNSDPAIGRFFNIDPLSEDYLHNSTYAFSENRVIDGIELEGLEFIPSFVFQPDQFVNTVEGINDWFTEKNKSWVSRRESLEATYIHINKEKPDFFTSLLFSYQGLFTSYGGSTDLEDVSVVTQGYTADGNIATRSDYVYAGVGILLPFLPGSALKQGLKRISPKSVEAQLVGESLDFTIDNGVINFSGRAKDVQYDFIIGTNGKFQIGNGHWYMSNQGEIDVAGAGRIGFDANWKINYIDNYSGHYQPSKDELLEQIRILGESGVVVSPEDLEVVYISRYCFAKN